MAFRTLEGVLHPDGKVTFPSDDLPDRPTRVMVTLLEPDEEISLAELGDYLDQLESYEERLARGEIQWR